MARRDDLLPGVPTRNVFVIFFAVVGPMAVVILSLALAGVEYPSPQAPNAAALYVLKDYLLIAIVALGTYGAGMKWAGLSWSTMGFHRCSVDWIVRAFLLAVMLFGFHLLWDVLLRSLGAGAILFQPMLADATVMFGDSRLQAASLGLAIVIFTPVVEEIFLRGILFAWLRRHLDFFLAAVASSIVFGVIHFEVVRYGQAIVFSIVAAYLYERSGSLWPPIALHVAINAIYLMMLR